MRSSVDMQRLVAVISSGLGGGVWDVVETANSRKLVVHVQDIGKWWEKAHAQFRRVFAVQGSDTQGLPVGVRLRPELGEGSEELGVQIVEPPVSFGMGVLWMALSLEERKVLGAEVYSRSAEKFRISVTGGLYRLAGRKCHPQEFMTPWAARVFLAWVLREDVWKVVGREAPKMWRSECGL